MKMQEGQASFLVTLTNENLSSRGLNGYISGAGIVSDVCKCLDLWTWEDVQEANLDYLDEHTRAIVRAFDWTKALRDEWNASADMNAGKHIHESEYLAGDYYEINTPEAFARECEARKAAATEYIEDNGFWEDCAEENVPAALIKQLRDEAAWAEKCLHAEWLKGDRSSPGCLDMISERITGTRGRVSVDEGKNELNILFTEDQAREFMSYDLGEDEPVTSPELEKCVIAWLLSKYDAELKKREERALERKQRAAEADAEKERKLEAKKAEARERKKKATQ